MIQYWAVVIVLVIVMIAIAVNNGHKKKLPSDGSTAPASKAGVSTKPAVHAGTTTTLAPTTTTTTTSTTTTTATATPQTLQSLTGSGTTSLSLFTVPTSNKGWLVHYLFNCANFGSTGNFQIYVQDSAGTTVDVAANLLGANGGSTYYNYTPGTYRLEINSECNWAVIVQTIPQ